MTKVKVTVHIHARYTPAASGTGNPKPQATDACSGRCRTCSGGGQTPPAGLGCHPANSLKQAAGILFKLANGEYEKEQVEGAFETAESLLRSYYSRKDVRHG